MGRPKKIDLTEDTRLQLRLELARKDFWEFCKMLAPDFYKDDRPYLKNICNQMQAFAENPEERVMVINAPPRHAKSRTAQLFTAWNFGRKPSEKVITGSYNEQLSTSFSRAVRDLITERKAGSRIVYSDIFPAVTIKRGSSAANMWTIAGQHISYLATSPNGTVTGFGASMMIIDDIIRNADEAYNETVLQNIWEWFTNTMMSRLEAGGKLIVIATRWHSDDLSGHIMRHYEDIGVPVRKIILRARQEDGTMLCPEILDRESYDILVKTMGRDIVEANYNNQPVDMVGRLYQQWFKEYSHIPKDEEGNSLFEGIYSYCDTADQGNDFLCNFIYGWYDGDAYILDAYYTDANMIDTEPETAKRLHKFNVDKAYIESNSGGRGFGRSVERILREKYHTTKPFIELFYQNKNKGARILGGATWVQEHVFFPAGWRNKWPELFNALYKYQKEIKGNKHDDAPDALTGIYDKMGRPNLFSFE